MNKTKWRNITKQYTIHNALKYLNEIKKKHSKVQHLKHKKLEMQSYLKPNDANIQKSETQNIYKLRCNMTKVKSNMSHMFDSLGCRICKNEIETQKHVYECETLWKQRKYEY